MVSTGPVGSVSAPGWALHHGYPLRHRTTADVGGMEVVKKYVRRRKSGDLDASAGVVALAPLPEPPKKVCVDCQTSITPLWRTGPGGPKSLCNACGIRYRKRKSGNSEQRRCKLRIGPGVATPSVSGGGAASPAGLKEEELMRLQREKQQRLLLLLLQRQRERQKKRGEAAGGIISVGDGEEETQAALLLMSLSSGISVHHP